MESQLLLLTACLFSHNCPNLTTYYFSNCHSLPTTLSKPCSRSAAHSPCHPQSFEITNVMMSSFCVGEPGVVPTYTHTLQCTLQPFTAASCSVIQALTSRSLNTFTGRCKISITYLPAKCSILYFSLFLSVPHSAAHSLAHSRCFTLLSLLGSYSILFMVLAYLLITAIHLPGFPGRWRAPCMHFLIPHSLA